MGNEVSSAAETWSDAGEVVDSILDLPPTYHAGEVGGFNQVIPDPVSQDALQEKMDRVDQAQANWEQKHGK